MTSRSLRNLLAWLLLALPTICTSIYFLFIASDRYVSEAQFVVRTASRPMGAAGLGVVLQMAGLGRSQDDVFSVQAYIGSRSATAKLADRLPLREFFGRPEADPLARYPSLLFGPSLEELHNYRGWMIKVIYSSTTGITTLRVEAFRAADAQRIADELLWLGEQAVNEMNSRIQNDAARTARATVERDHNRLVDAQVAITRFRNAELLIDPVGASLVATEVIGRLRAEMVQVEAQIREVSAAAATAPQLFSLQRRVQALEEQIARERLRISSDDGGMANKLAQYERLVLDREFAKGSLSGSMNALELAEREARRQQLYLERIVEPVTADYPLAPQRLRMIISALAVNVILLLVGWLVYAGAREHAAQG